MGNRLILIMIPLMLFSVNVATSDQKTQMETWWQDTYEPQQKMMQQQAISPAKQECMDDLDRWEEMLVSFPDSLYYQYKREQVTKRCLKYTD